MRRFVQGVLPKFDYRNFYYESIDTPFCFRISAIEEEVFSKLNYKEPNKQLHYTWLLKFFLSFTICFEINRIGAAHL